MVNKNDNIRSLYFDTMYKVYRYYLIRLDAQLSTFSLATYVNDPDCSLKKMIEDFKKLLDFATRRYQQHAVTVLIEYNDQKFSLLMVYFKFLKVVNRTIDAFSKVSESDPFYNGLRDECLNASIELNALGNTFLDNNL